MSSMATDPPSENFYPKSTELHNDELDTNSANANENAPDHDPPVHLLTDYIEVVYLPAAVCLGTFLNILVFKRLWKQWHRSEAVFGQRRAYLLLKFNLNIADFMVLLIYAFGRFCWVAAYQWYGGDFLCRAYHFLSLTAFHVTAFVMVTIALNRLRAAYSRVSLRNKRDVSVRFVRNMLILSWTLALACSSGQWCVWLAFAPPFEVFQADFVQCTTIWEVRKIHNNTIEADAMRENGSGETIYTLIHLLSAFWVPLVIIAVSYTLICVRYLNHVLLMAGRLRSPTPAETARLTTARFSVASHAITCSPGTTGTAVEPGLANDAQKKRQIRIKSFQVRVDTSPRQSHQSTLAQCRTRVFQTSGLVVLCYVCCWAPYNILALWKVVDPSSFFPLSEQLNILNALIVLNSVFNPLIYGFR